MQSIVKLFLLLEFFMKNMTGRESIMLIMIIFNCILLALSRPIIPETKLLFVVAFLLCDFIYFLEFFIEIGIYKRGIQDYVNKPNRILELIIILEAMTNIVIELLMLAGILSSEYSVIRLTSVLRVLRLTKYAYILPKTSILKRIAHSVYNAKNDITSTLTILTVMLLFFAIGSYLLFGNSLSYRCVDSAIAVDVTALSVYYQNKFNTPFFNPAFNEDCCGSSSDCNIHDVCLDLSSISHASYFSFSAPNEAFVTTFILTTWKGISQIFWLLKDSTGSNDLTILPVYGYVFMVIFLCSICLVYAFPGIIYGQLKLARNRALILKLQYDSTGKKVFTHFQMLALYYEYRRDRLLALANLTKTTNKSITGKQCVPRSHWFDKMRDLCVNSGCILEKIVGVVIIIDTLILSLYTAYSTPEEIRLYNIIAQALACVYMLECLLKLLFLGPHAYLTTKRHVIDLAIVLMVSAVTFSDLPEGLGLIRLLRLLQLCYILSRWTVRRSVIDPAKSDYLRKSSLQLGGCLILIKKCFKYIIAYVIIYLFGLLVFSLMGLILFWNTDEFQGRYPFQTYTSQSDAYLSRLNFNTFPNSFVTMFVSSSSDVWYFIMWAQIDGSDSQVKKKIAFAFFFCWIAFVYWLLPSILFASTLLVVDNVVTDVLITSALRFQYVTSKLLAIHLKFQLQRAFQTFKRNAFRGYKSIATVGEGLLVTEEIVWSEYAFLLKPFQKRKDWPLFIIPRDSKLRSFLMNILTSNIFGLIINVAVLINFSLALLSIIGVNVYNSNRASSSYMIFLTTSSPAFLIEMALKMLCYGLFFPIDSAYFSSALNTVDCVCNSLIITAIVIGNVDSTLVNVMRVLRLVRMPNTMKYFYPDSASRVFIDTVTGSIKSLISLTLIYSLFILYAALIGLHVWLSDFSRCNTDYPGGRDFNYKDSIYPNGCNLVNQGLDHFADIGFSMQSILRVVMFNQWHSILFPAMDATDQNHQPIENYNKATFLYFMVLVLVANVFNSLFVAVMYYHYSKYIYAGRRIVVRGMKEASWLVYDSRLKYFSSSNMEQFSNHKEHQIFWAKFWESQSYIVKAMRFVVVVTPFAFQLAFLDLTWTRYLDSGCNAYVCIDYARVLVLKNKILEVGFIECVNTSKRCLIFFAIAILIAFTYYSYNLEGKNLNIVLLITMILRCFYISLHMSNLKKIVSSILSGMAELLFVYTYIGLLLIVLAVAAVKVFYPFYIDVPYGGEFANGHYELRTFLGAFTFLINLACGEGWTGYMNAMFRSQSNIWVNIFWYLFLLGFYLLFETFKKILCIQYLMLYQRTSLDSSSVDLKLVQDFSLQWNRILKNRNQRGLTLDDTIDFLELMDLLSNLKEPLGLGRKVAYIELCRFTTNILLNMFKPEKNLSLNNDWGREELFKWGDVKLLTDPSRVRELQLLKFNFTQVLRAVHKKALLGTALFDEESSTKLREIAQTRLTILRWHLFMMISTNRNKGGQTGLLNRQSVLLLQRLDIKLYRGFFLELMSKHLQSLQQRVESFHMTSQDVYVLKTFKSLIETELKATKKQTELARRLKDEVGYSGSNAHRLQKFLETQLYYNSIQRLAEDLNKYWDSKVTRVWTIDTLIKDTPIHEKGNAISALAIDANNILYVALATGTIKIWKREQGTFLCVEELSMGGGLVRCFSIASDGKVFAACGDEVIKIVVNGALTTRMSLMTADALSQQRLFLKINVYTHTSAANAVCSYRKNFIIAGFVDGTVAMLSAQGNMMKTAKAGSEVFCMCTLKLKEEDVWKNDLKVSELLVCGTVSGKLFVLPLTEGKVDSWKGFAVPTGNAGISAVKTAWGYLYSGSISGVVKVWAVEVANKKGPSSDSIAEVVNLICVRSDAVHTDAISTLSFTGGHLFSASLDMCTAAWTAPTNLKAKVPRDFEQASYGAGVCHHGPIISMAANSNYLVTGDDQGSVVMRRPSSQSEDFPCEEFTEPKVFLSCLEHDFGPCFLPLANHKAFETIILTCTNNYHSAVIIMCIHSDSDVWRVEFESFSGSVAGMAAVPDGGGSASKRSVIISPNEKVAYRIKFSPREVMDYRCKIRFLIDGSKIRAVALKGSGIKPRIKVGGLLNPFELNVGVAYVRGDSGKSTSTQCVLQNPTPKALLLQCVGETAAEDEFNTVVLSDPLFKSGLTVEPRSLVLGPGQSATLTVNYMPVEEGYVSVKLNCRVFLSGECLGTVPLFQIRGEAKKEQATAATLALRPRSSDAYVFAEVVNKLKASLVHTTFPDDVAVKNLNNLAWQLHVERNKSVTAYLLSSVLFLRFNPSQSVRSVEGSELHIMYRSLDATSYELVSYNGTIIRSENIPEIRRDVDSFIILSASDLAVNRFHPDGTDAAHLGHIKLLLKLYTSPTTDISSSSPVRGSISQYLDSSLQPKSKTLLSTTSIELIRGYEFCASGQETRERIFVVGISEVKYPINVCSASPQSTTKSVGELAVKYGFTHDQRFASVSLAMDDPVTTSNNITFEVTDVVVDRSRVVYETSLTRLGGCTVDLLEPRVKRRHVKLGEELHEKRLEREVRVVHSTVDSTEVSSSVLCVPVGYFENENRLKNDMCTLQFDGPIPTKIKSPSLMVSVYEVDSDWHNDKKSMNEESVEVAESSALESLDRIGWTTLFDGGCTKIVSEMRCDDSNRKRYMIVSFSKTGVHIEYPNKEVRRILPDGLTYLLFSKMPSSSSPQSKDILVHILRQTAAPVGVPSILKSTWLEAERSETNKTVKTVLRGLVPNFQDEADESEEEKQLRTVSVTAREIFLQLIAYQEHFEEKRETSKVPLSLSPPQQQQRINYDYQKSCFMPFFYGNLTTTAEPVIPMKRGVAETVAGRHLKTVNSKRIGRQLNSSTIVRVLKSGRQSKNNRELTKEQIESVLESLSHFSRKQHGDQDFQVNFLSFSSWFDSVKVHKLKIMSTIDVFSDILKTAKFYQFSDSITLSTKHNASKPLQEDLLRVTRNKLLALDRIGPFPSKRCLITQRRESRMGSLHHHDGLLSSSFKSLSSQLSFRSDKTHKSAMKPSTTKRGLSVEQFMHSSSKSAKSSRRQIESIGRPDGRSVSGRSVGDNWSEWGEEETSPSKVPSNLGPLISLQSVKTTGKFHKGDEDLSPDSCMGQTLTFDRYTSINS